MTVTDLVNTGITIGLLPALIVVARRPSRRWRHGRAGKLVSVAALLTVTFHLGPVLVPLGALGALARHRHNPPERSPVPTANNWPGA